MISVIIRTKNEEKWINACLRSVLNQTVSDVEIIIVDNNSSDKTLQKVERFRKKFDSIKIVKVNEYIPGYALNEGIRSSVGEYLVCMSAHCIAVNEFWLENLQRNFDNEKIAAVYGRQEPMAFSSDADKRDLLNLFGLDKKIQKKDSFFHNANSMIRRDVWESLNFDEQATNIEDRIWADKILKQGYNIIYEPEASVFHYHGVHQDGNKERVKGVTRILEEMYYPSENNIIDPGTMHITAFIPAIGKVRKINNMPLLEMAIDDALDSKYIKEVIVLTDNEEHKKIAEQAGAKVPFLRPKELSNDYVALSDVYRFGLEQIENMGVYPDAVVSLEEGYVFRPYGFLDGLIEHLAQGGFDSVFPASGEIRTCFKKKNDSFENIGNFKPTKYKDPLYVSLVGLGCVVLPHVMRNDMRVGNNLGIYQLDSWLPSVYLKNDSLAEEVSLLFEEFYQNKNIEKRARRL